MNVWAVTMVRDEIDIIEQTLRHLASEGVTGIIVVDNMSVDGTWEWLQEAVNDFSCELRLFRDDEVGYYQSRKITRIAHHAFAYGADWVIPFDADEIWYSSRDKTLVEVIEEQQPKYHCLEARLFNHFPSSSDLDEPNPVWRIVHRDPKPAPLPKVIVGNRRDVTVLQGNHNATWADGEAFRVGVDIEIAHFPWRKPEQFEQKVRNGYQAYLATDLPEDMGAHWRLYGRALEEGGPAALRKIWDTWFFDPEMKLEVCPAPLRRFERDLRKR